MVPLISIGSGEHSRVIQDAIRDSEVYEWWGAIHSTDKPPPIDAHFIVAIGNNLIRHKVFQEFQSLKCVFATVIHPSASVSKHAKIEAGTFIGPLANIGPGVRIAENVIINSHVNVDHDCLIEESVHLGPGVVLGGGVEIGAYTMVGMNATIRDHCHVPPYCVIGQHANVVKSIDQPSAVYFGNPALLQRLNDEEAHHLPR